MDESQTWGYLCFDANDAKDLRLVHLVSAELFLSPHVQYWQRIPAISYIKHTFSGLYYGIGGRGEFYTSPPIVKYLQQHSTSCAYQCHNQYPFMQCGAGFWAHFIAPFLLLLRNMWIRRIKIMVARMRMTMTPTITPITIPMVFPVFPELVVEAAGATCV